MINFAPVMLCNKQPNYFDGVKDAIYIPPEFKPISMPKSLAVIQQAFLPYGITPDAMSMIVYKLLHFMHQPDLQDYIDVWDSRKTYELSAADKYDLILPAITVSSSRSPGCNMVPRYRYAANSSLITPGDSGKLTWTFRAANSTQTQLTNQRGVVSLETVIGNTTVDKSSEVTLVPGRYFAYFEVPSKILVGDYKFEYVIHLLPTYDISSIMLTIDNMLANSVSRAVLFERFAPAEDIMHDLQYTYQTSPEQSLRLGSVLMAFAYQVGRRAIMKELYVPAK